MRLYSTTAFVAFSDEGESKEKLGFQLLAG
jgi:hypothetical protein